MAFSDALGDDPANTAGNFLGVLGASILSGNRYEPFANFGQLMALKNKEMQGQTSRAALKALLIQAGATPEQAEQYSANEGVAKLALQNIENGKTDALIGGVMGGGAPVSNLGMGAPKVSPAAPGGPAAGASLNGGLSGDMGAFAGAIKAKESGGRYDIVGPTHPKMGRALGAYQVMEANLPQWSQEALGRTVTADEFLKSPEIQDAIFAKKFGQSVEKYGNPQDAASVWFTGRPAAQGASARDVLGTTGANYVASFNANLAKQRPTQVADASGAVPAAPAGLPVVDSRQPGFDPNSGVDPLAGFVSSTGQTNAIPTPTRPVAVADNEQQAQALEAQMGMLPAGANRADLPAENAVPATTTRPVFDIPPGQTSDTATTRTQVAQRDYTRNKLQAEVQADLQKIAVLGTRGDRAKGAIEALKLKVQAAQKYLEPTDAQKILQAAGISTDDPQGQKMLLGAIPGNADTSLQKEYGTYRRQEVSEGRVPLSQIDYDSKLRTAGKTDINIRNDAEKKEEVGRAESVTKFLGGIADSAPATAKRAASLDQLGRLISRTQTAQGTTLKAQLDGIGKELGLSTGELKTKADAINAITNSLAPQMREPGTGTVSDADLRGFLAALPSLSATPEGNQLILGGLKRATDVDRERTKIAAKWQSGKLSASEARAQIAEIDERSIYSSEAERSLVMGLSPIPENKARSGWRVLGVE